LITLILSVGPNVDFLNIILSGSYFCFSQPCFPGKHEARQNKQNDSCFQ
jgi:hypothetical protein